MYARPPRPPWWVKSREWTWSFQINCNGKVLKRAVKTISPYVSSWVKRRSLSPAVAEGEGTQEKDVNLPFGEMHFSCLPASRADKAEMNPQALLVFCIWPGCHLIPVKQQTVSVPTSVWGSSYQQFTTYSIKKYFCPFNCFKPTGLLRVPSGILWFVHSSDQHCHIFTIFIILWNFFSYLPSKPKSPRLSSLSALHLPLNTGQWQNTGDKLGWQRHQCAWKAVGKERV